MSEVTGRTKLIGLFGSPLHHSPIPRLVNAALETLPVAYLLAPFTVDAAGLKEALAAAKALRLSGLCLGSPLKEAAGPLLDELGPTSQKTGSVDTVSVAGGRLSGHNTELWSFLAALKEEAGVSPKGKRALLVGAGGTARSIGAALLQEGASRLTVCNRTPERAEQLAQDLARRLPGAKVSTAAYSPAEFRQTLQDTDILVNATPSDLQSSKGPLVTDKDLFPALLVFDAAYSPATPLLLSARRAGCTAMSGARMLLWQAFFGVRQWTGQEPKLDALERALRSLSEPALAA